MLMAPSALPAIPATAPATTPAAIAAATDRQPPLDAVALARLAIGLMLVLLPVTLLLGQIDPRQLNGVSIWAKPVKFQLSLAVHFATLAWLAYLLDPATRAGLALRLGFLAGLVAALGEILYIILQAARGRASHFNADTPLEATLYNVMGVGAVIIVLSAMQLGWMLRRGTRDGVGVGLRSGAVLGLLLGGAATLVTAGILGSGELSAGGHGVDGHGVGGHWVGGSRSDAGGLPLLGWSQEGGDLRVPHFFATHLMQALPLFGLLADRLWARRARRLTFCAALAGVGLVLATFLQALAGRPFLTLW